MNLNPVLVESSGVLFRTREYSIVHAVYVGVLAVATLVVWPSRGFMTFFASETVPAAFQAVAILQLLMVSGFSIYAGMDRLATARIIRYSEWLEHTRIRVGTLLGGKIVATVLHTVLFVVLGAPFLYIAAGPGGIPPRAVLSTQTIILFVGLFCRMIGMLISVVGEQRDVVRIVSSWIFLALYYLATIQLVPPFNPIIAVIRQQDEMSALVSSLDPVPFGSHPAVPSLAYLVAGLLVVLSFYWLTLYRRRRKATQRETDA